MNNFDANKVLSEDKIVNSAHSQIYKIGLSLIKTNDEVRNKIYNPYLVFTVNCIVFIKLCISISTEDKNILIMNGDFAHLLGVGIYLNFGIVLHIIFIITSQLIHYYNYKNDIKPNYLKVFQMMSGLVSPKSIGLTNENEINKMIKLTNKLFTHCKLNVRFLTIFCFCFNLFPIMMNCTIVETIIYGIPNSLLWALMCNYGFGIDLYQVLISHLSLSENQTQRS